MATKQKLQSSRPSREDIAGYIADEAASLSEIARRNGMELLAYLFDMARHSILTEERSSDQTKKDKK